MINFQCVTQGQELWRLNLHRTLHEDGNFRVVLGDDGCMADGAKGHSQSLVEYFIVNVPRKHEAYN